MTDTRKTRLAVIVVLTVLSIAGCTADVNEDIPATVAAAFTATAVSESNGSQEFLTASKQLIEIENRRVELIAAFILQGWGPRGIPTGGWREGSTGEKLLAFQDGLGEDNLSSLLFEIASTDVPYDLESTKSELLEIYRLEIMATYLSGDCISGDCDGLYGTRVRHSSRLEVNELNVIPKIQETNKLPTMGALSSLRIDSPWVTAQLQRAFVYERWLKQLNDIGVDVSESPWNSISLSEYCRNGEKLFC